MKLIRVLQVFTKMDRGGAESMIMNYYRNIDRTKIQFDFLVFRNERGAFDDEIETLGGKIYRIPNINILKLKQNNIDKFFKNNTKYTIVHSHLNAKSIYILKIAKKYNIPIRIAHSHTSLPQISFKYILNKKTTIKTTLTIIIKQFLKKNITKYATHNFACGKDAGIWLFGKKNLNKIKIINNAINLNSFKYNKLKSKNNRIAMKLDNKFVIGHVGNFHFTKNHNFIIDVFKEIHNLNNNSHLILIGDGILIEQIRDKVKRLNLQNYVSFLGVKKNISYYLQIMDAFILPSHFEGLPVTTIEAQASGLKTFVSDKVSLETKLTNLIEYISLDKSPKKWANKIINSASSYIRLVNFNNSLIKEYDINQNALDLQNFYLKNNNS